MASPSQSATSAQHDSGRESELFRFPPGLQRNLPLYLFRRFFRPGNPILLFEHLAKTFGPVSHYKLGGSNIVFINEPELIREILVTQASAFIKERTQNRMKILLGEGLITSEGDFHMRQRRIAAPAFHRQRIQSYAEMMVERGAAMRANWQPGQTFDMSAAMMELTLEIVARTLFATDVTAAIREINDEVNVIMRLYNYLIALPRAESYLRWPIPGLIRFRKARARLDAQVYRMIAERRAANEDRGDLLSMLMTARDEGETAAAVGHSRPLPPAGMSDRQLRDEVITIFLAGYETVANALTWTWYLLSENPAAAERMHHEIDEVLQGRLPTLEDVPRLRYTEMVFAESMRLYPPAWAMGRQSTQIIELGPYRLPAGTYFFFSQYILQRSEEFYPEPLRFDPERFTPEQKAVRPRFTYFPFGGGSRQCIGEAFAWMEGVLILATLAQRWSFHMVPGQAVDVQPKITLRPKYPLMMVAKERNANSARLEM
ncbi:MAG TPA: cytochrome P450 [Acidobacteriaceae bacterium]|nr:cytochrome P450 [Acidobacteriaceae bacterium]